MILETINIQVCRQLLCWRQFSCPLQLPFMKLVTVSSYNSFSCIHCNSFIGLGKPFGEINLNWLYFPSINLFSSSLFPILLRKLRISGESFLYQYLPSYIHWPVWDSFCHLLLWPPFLFIFGVLVSLMFLFPRSANSPYDILLLLANKLD